MSKRNIIYCLLTVVFMVYILFSLAGTNFMAANAKCEEVRIDVAENDMAQFVTPENIDREMHGIKARYSGVAASSIPLQQIEDEINALINVETANVYRTADNALQIDVIPMIPVIRVFEDTCSYYINSTGKHLKADIHYNIDVPVVIRRPGAPEAVIAVDLARRISQTPAWAQLVTSLEISPEGDIYLIPSISGHIINFGDQHNIDDKFRRIFAFYNKVMPLKGWDNYDVISVKFAGQIIGSLSPNNQRKKIDYFVADIPDTSEEIDNASIETSLNPDEFIPRIN